MPSKNKPKRLDRARSWRVARRKRAIKRLLTGNKRNRKPRPKNKGLAKAKTTNTEVKTQTKEE